MIYIIAGATAAMLGMMLWMAVFRMRRDRVSAERERTRGKFAFRPRERVRYLLNRSFQVPEERPEWEEQLVSRVSSPGVQGRRDA